MEEFEEKNAKLRSFTVYWFCSFYTTQKMFKDATFVSSVLFRAHSFLDNDALWGILGSIWYYGPVICIFVQYAEYCGQWLFYWPATDSRAFEIGIDSGKIQISLFELTTDGSGSCPVILRINLIIKVWLKYLKKSFIKSCNLNLLYYFTLLLYIYISIWK